LKVTSPAMVTLFGVVPELELLLLLAVLPEPLLAEVVLVEQPAAAMATSATAERAARREALNNAGLFSRFMAEGTFL